ncbi:DHHA1 domain-containing protein [Algibacillus agarilyticus]|uniref:DHHA1 domain-containing protein n=1 Tax=Algibacillus agarilyticus TaxID=2234133 RepID=UPI000DCFBF03|nr:DHH family phosphoesterase [Algibacillus agarilyticus]
MANYDVFNGDADGICALLQLRLAQPLDAKLVTGVKRDIKLLSQVDVEKAKQVTVLDISMDKNKEPLQALLAKQVNVFYCDHHYAGDIPASAYLEHIIDTAPDTCTSLLVNQYLDGAYAHWAVVAAYGDNMLTAAEQLADSLKLTKTEKSNLKALGIAINYNGYGANESDLHIAPSTLFEQLLDFNNPLDLIAQNHAIYRDLIANYQADLVQVEQAEMLHDSCVGTIYSLPNEKWARRISGVWGNDLANKSPNKAHAVFTELAEGGYLVSVRSPKKNAVGADDLCRQFNTGGGRKAAAGINHLPENELDRFITTFEETFV